MQVPVQTFFKIMNKDTGEFSSGGRTPSWTARGKAWNTMGFLRSHLSQVRSTRSYVFGGSAWGNHLPNIYRSGKAVIVELETKAVSTKPVLDELDEIEKRRDDKAQRQEKARQRERTKREKAQLKKLLAKHGSP